MHKMDCELCSFCDVTNTQLAHRSLRKNKGLHETLQLSKNVQLVIFDNQLLMLKFNVDIFLNILLSIINSLFDLLSVQLNERFKSEFLMKIIRYTIYMMYINHYFFNTQFFSNIFNQTVQICTVSFFSVF